MACAICGKDTPGKFTVRESYIQAGGWGYIPPEARVHPKCNEREQRDLKSGKIKLSDLWQKGQPRLWTSLHTSPQAHEDGRKVRYKMSDTTMPERIIAGYGFHGYEWSLPESVMAYRLESVTEYIRADALRAKLGGYHDSDLLSLAESLRTFHDGYEVTMERLQEENSLQRDIIAAQKARLWELQQRIVELETAQA